LNGEEDVTGGGRNYRGKVVWSDYNRSIKKSSVLLRQVAKNKQKKEREANVCPPASPEVG